MKVSARVRYGFRAMTVLAAWEGPGPLTLEAMATQQEIPERYLAKILQDLRRSGLVRSVRGAHGGWILAFPPNEITALDIWEALEGNVDLVECVQVSCEDFDICGLHDMFYALQRAHHDVLSGATLASIITAPVHDTE